MDSIHIFRNKLLAEKENKRSDTEGLLAMLFFVSAVLLAFYIH
jgi:hypothetical protein